MVKEPLPDADKLSEADIEEHVMLDLEIRNNYLVDELQLGTRLNEAVSAGNRADFALMLAMISQDVTDDASVVDPVKTKPRADDLRKMFSLLPERSFYAEAQDFGMEDRIGECVANGAASAVQLLLSARGEPLALKEDSIGHDVRSNLSPLARAKADSALAGTAVARVPYDLRTLAIVDAVTESRNILEKI